MKYLTSFLDNLSHVVSVKWPPSSFSNSSRTSSAVITTSQSSLRACADRSWATGRSALPTVANPPFPDESPNDDDHVGEGYPEVDDLSPTLRAPKELLVG